MGYTVIETQTNNGAMSVLHTEFTDGQEEQAHQKYHEVLSYASVSNVQYHGAAILDSECCVLRSEVYKHDVEE